MSDLAARNMMDVKKNTVSPDKWSEGKEKPMSVRERMTRQRIKKKAQTAIRDLILAGVAGIIPDKKQQKEGKVKSIDGMCNKMADAFMCTMLDMEDEYDMGLFAYGGLPNTETLYKTKAIKKGTKVIQPCQ